MRKSEDTGITPKTHSFQELEDKIVYPLEKYVTSWDILPWWLTFERIVYSFNTLQMKWLKMGIIKNKEDKNNVIFFSIIERKLNEIPQYLSSLKRHGTKMSILE